MVTGSSSGIGRAIALRLARGGARVVVNYARSRELADGPALHALGDALAAFFAHLGGSRHVARRQRAPARSLSGGRWPQHVVVRLEVGLSGGPVGGLRRLAAALSSRLLREGWR